MYRCISIPFFMRYLCLRLLSSQTAALKTSLINRLDIIRMVSINNKNNCFELYIVCYVPTIF
jgi:hypothetical protein